MQTDLKTRDGSLPAACRAAIKGKTGFRFF
jgi:hypothetical protein